MSDIKIVVVTHKAYSFPNNKDLYLPVQSGSAIWESLGIQRDDFGENISSKNLSFNELCPMYWAWKNLQADYIGVCHYRRYFSDSKRNGTKMEQILRYETAQRLVNEFDIILPPVKKYVFTTLERHYINSLSGYVEIHQNDIRALGSAIKEENGEYYSTFIEVMHSNKAHMLHMCLMSKRKYDEYCSFLFPIMFKCELLLENRKDKSRYIGALSEFLMDVWIKKNDYRYYELGLVELEHENLIDKSIRVLKRKLKGN